MIVEGRRVALPRGGTLPHLLSPTREQRIALAFDERCQFLEVLSGHPGFPFRSPALVAEDAVEVTDPDPHAELTEFVRAVVRRMV